MIGRWRSWLLARRLAACLILIPVVAWAQAPVRTYLLQNAATANGNGIVAHAAGFSVANVQVAIPTGASPVFTVTFQQSQNDNHYFSTLCYHVAGGSAVTVTTAPGQFRCNIAGSLWFRTPISGYTGAGSITVIATLTTDGPVATALNAPEGSQTVNQGGTWVANVHATQSGAWTIQASHAIQSGAWTIQAAHQAGIWRIDHVTSVMHVSAAGVFPVQQGPAGAARWPIDAHQAGAWNVDKVSHLTSAMAHVIGTVTAEGRGTAGSPAGGVVSVQGVASGTAVPVSLGTISASQSGTWTIQASHQGGQWNVAHATSATHVVGVVDRPSYWQSHTFSTAGAGVTIATTSGPVRSFTVQAAVTRGSATRWYVHLEASLDGNSFTKVLGHEQATGDGAAVFSGGTFYPARYFRSQLYGWTGDGLLVVHVMGMS